MQKKGKMIVMAAGIAVLFLFIAVASDAVMVLSDGSTTIGNTVMLNAESSDAAVNGTALLNTLGSLTGSTDNRYVIKLGPGTYDVGTATVAMKDYVDLEGSGEDVTVITGHPDGPATVTAFGVSVAELRFLTVQNSGGGSVAVAIGDGGGLKITHVYAKATGSPTNHAIENHCPTPPCAIVMMNSVFATVDYTGGSENIGVVNDSDSSVAMSNVITDVYSGSGSNTNVGILDLNMAPVMRDVYAMANGGQDAVGIIDNNSSGQMFNVYAFASDATGSNTGIVNKTNSAPTMKDVRAEGSGGTDSIGMSNTACGSSKTTTSNVTAIGHNATGTNIGVLNNGCSYIFSSLSAMATPAYNGAYHAGIKNVEASPIIQSSSIRVPDNDENCNGGCYGIHNTGTGGTVKIDGSQIHTAPTATASATIKNESGWTTYVGNSKLAGNTVSNAGTMKCIGSYNATYDSLDNTCLATP